LGPGPGQRILVVLYGLIVFFVFLLAFLSAFRTFFPASSVFFATFALAFSVLVFFPTASFAFSVLLFPSFAIAVLLLVDRVLVASSGFPVFDVPPGEPVKTPPGRESNLLGTRSPARLDRLDARAIRLTIGSRQLR
jgi:hypothetical protein